MGLRFEAALEGKSYNKHIKFGTDRNVFHEAAVILNCSYPPLVPSILEKQMACEMIQYPLDSDVEEAVLVSPVWNRYSICQDSASHFRIKKQTKPQCCTLDCLNGERASGVMAVNGESGGIVLGIKDFWQKHPSGLEAEGLNNELTNCTAWFYSPEASAYDFRHYDTESYPSLYEGFKDFGASAYGISVTSECTLSLVENVPSDERMTEYSKKIEKPAVYMGTPEYYHEKKAFGYWSLQKKDTEVEIWIEEQLDKAVNFYLEEVQNRNWYGLFDYGDFMHTYDRIRHCWKYDTGGFAWQNTELVPTYWLWLYFLRTGREDVFTLAEAMSRHCSEVDFYHFGKMKGIGTRHNVRHWGCSCKEPRVSMAGHNRFYYYLTGDYRMGDVLSDVKDADKSMADLKHFVKKNAAGQDVVMVRTGPDWSSFVSNWMTEYERTLDEKYRKKIENGISSLKNTPLGLASGPSFEYDFSESQLIYLGEDDNSGNMHLAISMGGPQIWFETADMLEDEKFKDMLAAYSADRQGNHKLAKSVWNELIGTLVKNNQNEGFEPTAYAIRADGKELKEIPWIKTNFTAQWCLNAIVSLEFIRQYLPDTLENMMEMLYEMPEDTFHRA